MLTALVSLTLATIAVARLTRLITIDKIAEPARGWIVRSLGETHPLTYLVHCPWCMSIWVAIAPTAGLATTGHLAPLGELWLTAPLVWLATAHLSALLITRGEA